MNIGKIKNINLLFIFVIVLLSCIGTAALYSAADGNFDLWAKKHIIRFGIFLILCIFISLLDIKIIYTYSYLIFIISLLLLISVEVIGTLGKGTTRWVNIYGISLQPSELIKVSIILALAKFYHDLRFENIRKIQNLIFPVIIIFIPFLLVLNQPDLGTSASILLIGIFIMFHAGVKIWKFIRIIFHLLFRIIEFDSF